MNCTILPAIIEDAGPIASMSKRLIPLGVFLAAAAAIAYGWGPQMLDWYLTEIVGIT